VLYKVGFDLQMVVDGIVCVKLVNFFTLEGKRRKRVRVEVVNRTVDIGHQNIVQIFLKIFFHVLEILEKI
jgi:hypothetical protein